MKDLIQVGGIWLRKEGVGTKCKIVVLAEVDGKFRRLIEESIELAEHANVEISHIVEPSGIRSAPTDKFAEVE